MLLILGCNLNFLQTFGQNWKPYNASNICNYSSSDLFSDIAVVKVDSFYLVNSDTVFCLNKVICRQDQLTSQFLKDKFRTINKNYFVFSDSSEFVFKINSYLGDTWIFDTLNNIRATVLLLDSKIIFGISDSIKIIALSTNDTIIISKKFGIISFQPPNSKPKFNLIGIENLSLGYQVPKYLDFFNFSEGDIFEYKEIQSNKTTTIFDNINLEYYKKIKILKKDSLINGFKYLIEKFVIDTFKNQYYFKEGIDTLVYVEDKSSFLNYYNHQRFINEYGFTSIKFSHNSFFDTDVKEYYINRLGPPYSENVEYGVSMGLINSNCSIYENLHTLVTNESLIGFKHNKMIYGTIHSDSFFRGIEQLDDTTEIAIYPNPVRSYIEIKFKGANQSISYKLMNIKGQNVRTDNLNNNIIDMSNLASGTYFLSIKLKDKVLIKKIIKLSD